MNLYVKKSRCITPHCHGEYYLPFYTFLYYVKYTSEIINVSSMIHFQIGEVEGIVYDRPQKEETIHPSSGVNRVIHGNMYNPFPREGDPSTL